MHDAIAEFVKIEQTGCDREATTLPLAEIGVDDNLHSSPYCRTTADITTE